MNEQDRQAVEAARGSWPDDNVVQALVAIIDRLDQRLTKVREAGEPFKVFYELTLSRLPDISWVVRKGRIETGDFRRLVQTLGKIEEVEDGRG